MTFRLFSILAAFVAMIGQTGTADAQRRGERLYIFERTIVDATKKTVDIDLSEARGAVRALRVRTPRDPLLLSNVRVYYSDGSTFDERRRINLLAGERTRPIDPRAEDRFVDKLTLFINPDTGKRGSVAVQILSHQTRAGRRARRSDEQTPAQKSVEREEKTRTASSGSILETPEPEMTGQGEILFGAQRVSLGLDQDTIRVSPKVGRFQRVRLRVLENDVFLNEVKINYADGQSRTFTVEAEVAKNSSSRWFQLDQSKFIKDINLGYRSRANFQGRARVEVFGEFARGWLGTSGEGQRFNEGWVLLGAQTAGFVGFDDDTVPIGRNKGGFRQLRITVRDRAITLNEVFIQYSDGRSDTVPVKARVDANSNWGPFDLSGHRRPIKEVRARYRSRFFDRDAVGRGAAVVEIWGRY